MRLPRMTMRLWMVAVVGAAVMTWIAVTAYRIEHDVQHSWLHHHWAVKALPGISYPPSIGTFCQSPFWPRYWRTLLGQPWPGTWKCRCTDPQRNILFIHHEMVSTWAGPVPERPPPRGSTRGPGRTVRR